MNHKVLEELDQKNKPVDLILCKNGVPVDLVEDESKKPNEIKDLAEPDIAKKNTGKLVVEGDEMWSFYKKKGNQRWLWSVIDHATGTTVVH